MDVSYNLSAQLADNLKFYEELAESRSSASVPEKSQVPLVWDLYMDTRQPSAGPLTLPSANRGRGEPLEWVPQAASGSPWEGEPELAQGEEDLLGQLNNRLKTQARRYPHPITNEMEALP